MITTVPVAKPRFVIAALLCSTLSVAAIAQTKAPSGVALEEVIVTAEKRATSLQDTALAVSAFSGLELDRALINKSLDLQLHVPNMLMSKGNFTTAQITIRGIGNLGVGSATDSGTGSHFNGVYLNNGRIFETEYYDAERVEVLRGPQGTLYGRNTTAGVVNFITRKPQDTFGGDITVELGDYQHRKLKGAINLPVTDRLAQRFSVFYTERDGYVENKFSGDDIDGRDMYSLRSGTRWAGDNVDATLTVNYFKEDSNRMRGSNQRCTRDPEGILGCLPTSLGDDTAHSGATASAFLVNTFVAPALGVTFPEDDFINSPNNSDPREQWLDFEPNYEVEDVMASFEVDWTLGDYTLTSLSGYHQSDLDAMNDYDFTVASEPWPITVTTQAGPAGSITTDRLYNVDRSTTEPEQWSQEFRLASNHQGPWNFLLGAFYLTYEGDTHYYIYSAAAEAAGAALGVDPAFRLYDNHDRKFELETWAGFGELYWQALEDVKLTFGFRYTEEEKKSSQRTIYLAFLDDGGAPDGGYTDYQADWDEPTGKFNVSWDINDDVMTYLTLSRSYKSGGFNPISSESPLLDPEQGGDPDLANFDPEYINAFEVGLKSRLFDNRLQANVTYFYYDYEGLQIAKITNQTAINENFDATIQGFEGEFIWLPDDHWRLSANLAWLDSGLDGGQSVDPADINRLGTTENIVSGPFGNQYVGPGCPQGTASCDGLPKSLDGNELPNAPQFSANLGAAYSWFLENSLQFTAAVNYYWQDEFYTRVFNETNDQVESWDVWNATLSVTSANRNWYAELWGRNLGDDDSVTGQYLGDQNVGLATNQFLLEPRTWGVTLGYNF
tara:strand:+ start:5005 stop:7518 length:2514 start_codon:yes stop_codon:yes gene_type:complete